MDRVVRSRAFTALKYGSRVHSDAEGQRQNPMRVNARVLLKCRTAASRPAQGDRERFHPMPHGSSLSNAQLPNRRRAAYRAVIRASIPQCGSVPF